MSGHVPYYGQQSPPWRSAKTVHGSELQIINHVYAGLGL
jgi:hypothetical protein